MAKNLTEKQMNKAVEIADELATTYGAIDTSDFMDKTRNDINSNSNVIKQNGKNRANNFTTQLIQLVLDQVLYDTTGYTGLYSWVNSFDDGFMSEGNTKQFGISLIGTNTTYDKTKYIPNNTTEVYSEWFNGQFYNGYNVLADNSYQYKKSQVLITNDWFPYFMSGNLGKYIAQVVSDAQKQFIIFKAYQVQQIIKKLAAGGAQVTKANAGINGSALKLKTITSNATDMFSAIVEFLVYLNDFKTDINKYTLASDSDNIENVDGSDYLIFAPKELIAQFYSGVLSRLPSAQLFNIEDVLNKNNLVQVGRELTNTTNADQTGVVGMNDLPFIDKTKIVVLSKKAIRHIMTLETSGNQFYVENLASQLVIHKWGTFVVLPFEKGFVFECANLLTPTP